MAPIAFVAMAFVMGCSDDQGPAQEDASADRGDDAVDSGDPSGADTFGQGETSNGNQEDTGTVTTLEPDPDTTMGGETETGDGPEVETTSVGFIYGPPDSTGGSPFDCDIWEQDCPDGEKCNPWANDGGGAWNATRCVPVDDDPDQVGEACEVEGSGVSGLDSCDFGSMCWEVDPRTNVGECVALCQGSEDAPVCEPEGTVCAQANGGVIILCLDACNPALMDCEEGEACYPIDDAFVCAPDVGNPGGYGEDCEFAAACDPGLACIQGALVPGCESAGCCSDYCDTSDPEGDAQCVGVADGAQCFPFYEEDPPRGYEDLGICRLP